MLDGDSILGSHGYSLLGTVNMTFIFFHPIHAEDDIKSILPQDNKVGMKFLALDVEWCVFTREFKFG